MTSDDILSAKTKMTQHRSKSIEKSFLTGIPTQRLSYTGELQTEKLIGLFGNTRMQGFKPGFPLFETLLWDRRLEQPVACFII